MALADLVPSRWRRGIIIVPVVRLSGVIGGTGSSLRAGMSLATLETALVQAFSIKAAPLVALVINSPGGTAVQSHLIHQRIRALAAEKEKKVVAAV